MSGKVNVAVLILVVLIAISLSAAGAGFYLLQNERAKTQELSLKIEELNAKQKITETQLKDSEKVIAETKVKLQEAGSQIDSLKGDLQRETSARQEAMAMMDQVKPDLESQKKSRADLEKRFVQAQDDLKKTQDQLKELDSKKTDLEAKINILEAKAKSVELGNIVVTPEPTTVAPVSTEAKPAPVAKAKEKKAEPAKKKAAAQKETATLKQAPSGEGSVLVVNKDYNFTVISLGNKDGVRTGDVFSVYHNNKYLGDIKVEKVHDSMSAAGFLSADMKNKINEGDKVLQKGK
jgi:hypothetical protein